MLYLIISFDYEDIYWILERKKLHNPRVAFVNLFMYELTMIWRQKVRIVHGLHLSGSLVEYWCILVHEKGNMKPPEWTHVYVYRLAINTIVYWHPTWVTRFTAGLVVVSFTRFWLVSVCLFWCLYCWPEKCSLLAIFMSTSLQCRKILHGQLYCQLVPAQSLWVRVVRLQATTLSIPAGIWIGTCRL